MKFATSTKTLVSARKGMSSPPVIITAKLRPLGAKGVKRWTIEMAKVGRPSSFDQKIADKICDMLAMDNSLASICEAEDMPSTTTVYRWRDANEQFRGDYARARELQGHTVADTIGDIRRKIIAGEVEWQVGKAAADLAKWESSRRAARDFGDKLDLTSGGDKLSDDLDPVARATRLAAIFADIEKRRGNEPD